MGCHSGNTCYFHFTHDGLTFAKRALSPLNCINFNLLTSLVCRKQSKSLSQTLHSGHLCPVMWIQQVGGSHTSNSHIPVQSTPGSSAWASNSAWGEHLRLKTSGEISCSVIQISGRTSSQTTPQSSHRAPVLHKKRCLLTVIRFLSALKKAKIRPPTSYASVPLTGPYRRLETEVRWALSPNSIWIY